MDSNTEKIQEINITQQSETPIILAFPSLKKHIQRPKQIINFLS
jgi:hypothetical protein